MVELVPCPNCGKKFPVNLDKHKNRNYRISPCCHVKVQRPSFFNKGWSPSKAWIEKREEDRRIALRKRRKRLEELGFLKILGR